MSEKHEIATVSRRKFPHPAAGVGAMLLVLSGCAGVPEQSVAPLDKQEAVARIAKSRWDALIKGDFEAAYKLMSPASRSLITLEEFRGRSVAVTWKAANVRKVECSGDDVCAVEVEATYVYQPRARRLGRKVEIDQVLAETWRNTAGGWWYVR